MAKTVTGSSPVLHDDCQSMIPALSYTEIIFEKEGNVDSFSYHVHNRGPVHALQMRLQG